MTKNNCFVTIANVGDKMTYTLLYLKQHQTEGIDLSLDFNKEVELLSEVTKIGPCHVKGNYRFLDDNYLSFNLKAVAEVTFVAADTLNLIKKRVEVQIEDELANNDKTEYQIKDGKIDLYELVWGWFVAEMPLIVYEKEK
ncbi:MAG: hypothetical protein WCS12_03740 [Acholeplasmataceae bacterium]|nr:hypothetical protein [Acholeplasmataceae bacterium]MCK9234072.1 hypothetical protein [Acholeplasmataceae bacterium]MCK9288750.1 hypothetical protein [Acholeplasmataceae bacterium]MDD4090350.1 hypothetical protein [Acholeplasmataceae bacterium]